MGGRRQRAVRRASSGAQRCAACLSANLWASDKVKRLSSAISLPALQESRREILWSCRGPAIHGRRGDKSTALEFTAVWLNIAVQLSSIEPDKLPVGLRRGGNLEKLFKRNIYAQFFLQLAFRRFVVIFRIADVTGRARVPQKRISIFPARPLLKIKVGCLVENKDMDSAMIQVIPMHFGAACIA